MLVVLHWTFSNSTMSLLRYRDQKCIQYSRCECPMDLYNGIMMPSVLFSLPFLMRPKILLSCLVTAKFNYHSDQSVEIFTHGKICVGQTSGHSSCCLLFCSPTSQVHCFSVLFPKFIIIDIQTLITCIYYYLVGCMLMKGVDHENLPSPGKWKICDKCLVIFN